jgi:pilus assembly protein CpaB
MGPLVSVVVARTNARAGAALTADATARLLETRRVPARYAPPGTLGSMGEAVGYRLAVPLRRGDYVTTTSLLSGSGASQGKPEEGRAVEVEVAGAGSLGSALQPGRHVDVLITTGDGRRPARTYLALQDAELLGFAPAAAAAGDAETAKATATLRVSLRQAVLLTAAQNFARELRLVPRSSDDRGRLGEVGVSASSLEG